MHFALRIALRGVPFALGLAASPALAQDCPEGDWFCEPAPEAPAAPTPPEPAPSTTPAPEPAPDVEPAERRGRVRLAHPEAALTTPPSMRRVPRRSSFRKWALDVHVFGVILRDSDADPNAGMGGVGAGFRYRPIPHLALDGSLELAIGTDYNGFSRREGGLLASAVGFLNPKHAVVAYALTGLGVSMADVEVERDGGDLPLSDYDDRYRYFGMHLGGGVEAHVSRRSAVRAELLGFVRTRTDHRRDDRPEFVDASNHRATNTSGGGLVRVGVMFYF